MSHTISGHVAARISDDVTAFTHHESTEPAKKRKVAGPGRTISVTTDSAKVATILKAVFDELFEDVTAA